MKNIRKSLIAGSLALVLPVSFTSCTNFNTRAKNDAATGALLGAGAGAALGGDGDRVEGALLGGALGGAAGYAVGKSR